MSNIVINNTESSSSFSGTGNICIGTDLSSFSSTTSNQFSISNGNVPVITGDLTNNNIAFFYNSITGPYVAGAKNSIFITNTTASPSTGISGGSILYSNISGLLMLQAQSGPVVSLNPHLTTVSNTGTYTVSAIDNIIGVASTTTTPVTVNLPAASALQPGYRMYVVDTGGNAQINNITVRTAGSDTIFATDSILINLNYMSLGLYSDGVSKWFLH